MGTECVESCGAGFFQDEITNICTQCLGGCQSCSSTVNTCTECKEGEVLYEGKCQIDIQKGCYFTCKHCDNEGFTSCSKCMDIRELKYLKG